MKPILILDAFITDEAEENLLVSFIDNVKSLGDDVLLMSNTTISKKTQEKVNYFFYDKRNQLFTKKYDNYKELYYYTIHDSFKVSNFFSHPQPHGLSVLISLFRSIKIAKDLGYTHFYKMEYDAILGEETKKKILEMNKSCELNNKKGVFFTGIGDNRVVEAHYFFCEIDFFLDNFWCIGSEQDYIDYLEKEIGNNDFLTMEEFIYSNLMKLNTNDVYINTGLTEIFFDTYFNSKHTKVYYDEKYNQCFTKFYHVKDDPSKIVIYSVNKKISPDFRKIIVIHKNDKQSIFNQSFGGYNNWSYHVVDNDVEKMMVYDQDNSFLYEEHFENVKNIIEFY